MGDTPSPSRVEKFNQAIRGTVTLILVVCFCYLAIIKEIDAGLFATTVTMVVSFWFATRGGQPGTTVTTGGNGSTVTTTGDTKITTPDPTKQ